MRIRTVKPEFWRSQDTVELDMFTRLLFIGLWNYVDDNGVGEDDVSLIRSDLFPRDTNVKELSGNIHRALIELSRRGHITRYLALKSGRRYFKVVAWHHQKINRPTESKKPLPTSDDTYLNDDSPQAHETLTEDSLPYLGSEGARDRGSEVPPCPPTLETNGAVVALRPTGAEIARARIGNAPVVGSVNAREIAHAYNRSLNVPLTAKVLGEMSTVIDECLRAGIPTDAIAAGMREWTRSDSWSPSQIPNFVHKAANRNSQRPDAIGKPSLTALDYKAAAEELLAKVGTN